MKSKYNTDLTGMRFNKLTAIKGLSEYANNNSYKTYQKWLCRCDCGKEVISTSYNLVKGLSGSCGISGCGRKNNEIPDYIGKTFGKLKVIELLKEKRSGQRLWLCLCSCGKTKKVKSFKLKNGCTTDCGCGQIKYEDRTIPAKKLIFSDYKRRARLDGKAFTLSFDDFIKIISGDCLYCNKQPTNVRVSNSAYVHESSFVYNGIDRINNDIGYVKDNCVPCCFQCNSAKMNRTVDDFVRWSFLVFNNLSNKKLI